MYSSGCGDELGGRNVEWGGGCGGWSGIEVLGVDGRDGMDRVDKGARTEHDGDVDEEKS